MDLTNVSDTVIDLKDSSIFRIYSDNEFYFGQVEISGITSRHFSCYVISLSSFSIVLMSDWFKYLNSQARFLKIGEASTFISSFNNFFHMENITIEWTPDLSPPDLSIFNSKSGTV
jgi:hypothetical protein